MSGTLKWYLTTGSNIVKKVESKQNITLEDATILALRQELFEGKAEDDFLQSCKDNPLFNRSWISLIKEAIDNGQTVDEIKIFAQPDKLRWSTAYNLKLAFDKGYSKERVSLVLNPEFNKEQVETLARIINSNINDDIVKLVANPNFKPTVMQNIADFLADDKSDKKKFKELLNKGYKVDSAIELLILLDRYKNDLTQDQKSLLMNPEFNSSQLDVLAYEMAVYHTTPEQMKDVADPKLSANQMQRKINDMSGVLSLSTVTKSLKSLGFKRDTSLGIDGGVDTGDTYYGYLYKGVLPIALVITNGYGGMEGISYKSNATKFSFNTADKDMKYTMEVLCNKYNVPFDTVFKQSKDKLHDIEEQFEDSLFDDFYNIDSVKGEINYNKLTELCDSAIDACTEIILKFK